MPSLAKITDGNKTDAQNTSCQSPWKLKFPCINSTWCQKYHRLFTEAVISSVLWILCATMLKKNPLFGFPVTFPSIPAGCWAGAEHRTTTNGNKPLLLALRLEPNSDQIYKESFWDWIFSALLINHSPNWIYFILQKRCSNKISMLKTSTDGSQREDSPLCKRMPWFLSWERTGSIYWPLKISWALGMRRSMERRRSNSLISKHDLACETKPDCLRGPPWCLKEQVYCHLQMCLSRHEEISFSCLSSNSNILRLQNRRNEGNEIEQKDCTEKFKKYI